MSLRSPRVCGAAIAVAAGTMWLAACGTPPQEGFVGAGCYDHRNRIVPTIHTPSECAANTWVWRTQPWQPAAPKP